MSKDELSAGGVVLSVSPDAKDFGTKLKSMVLGKTAGVGESMGGMIKDGLKSMVGPVAAVAGAMSIEHIVEGSIHSFEDLAGSVNSMKRIIGGSVEDVSALRGAFQLAGVDTDAATTSLAKLSKTLFSDLGSKKGTPAGAAMRELGIKFHDAHGQILPMTDLMPKLSEQFSKMPDGANKTALAMTLFGRSGTQMLPFLNKGAAGIAELESKAKTMGLTLDQAGIEKFKESRKEQREFQATLQGLTVTLGQAFLPVLEGVQNAFRQYLIPLIEKATAFVKAHQGEFDKLGETLKNLILPVIGATINIVSDLVTWILKNRDTVVALVTVIGTAMLAFKAYTLIMGAVKTAKMLFAAATVAEEGATTGATVAQGLLNATLTDNPIGIVVVAIGALVGALIWFFTQTKLGQHIWGDFVKGITYLWTGFSKFFGQTVKVLGTVFKPVFDFVTSIFKGYINGWLFLLESFINFFIGGLNGGFKAVNGLFDMVKQATGGKIDLHVGSIGTVHLPRLAEGGVVPATPGGRIVQVAEAGQAEAIIPLSKLSNLGGGKQTIIHYYAAKNDSIDAKQKLVDAVQRAKLLGAV